MTTVWVVAESETVAEESSLVGSGAFSRVSKVRLTKDLPSSSNEEEASSSRSSGASDENKETLCCYALKRLQDGEHAQGDLGKAAAAQDLLIEAKILANLPRHENLVILHAVSADFWRDPARGFLLLEYLPESLESRLAKWKQQQDVVSPKQRILQVCLPVARAQAFLHQFNICYRNLKPENIGFGADGKLRLYDFGLARKVKSNKLSLKKRVGTPRYMAPEVMQSKCHGTPADVYSLAMVMWEVLMNKKPFESVTDFEQLVELVAEQHARPSLWTMPGGVKQQQVKDVLSWCWHQDQAQRPSADQVVADLTRICGKRSTTATTAVKASVAPCAA